MKICSKQFFSAHMFGLDMDKLSVKEKREARITSIVLGIFTLGIMHGACALIFLPGRVCKSSPPVSSKINHQVLFKKGDNDFSGYSQDDLKILQFAENCCSFPKLALFIVQKYKKDAHEVCKQINIAGHAKNPAQGIPDFLSANDVLPLL